MSNFHLHIGAWSGLGLHGSCICCHNYFEFICAVVLCPEDIVSLQSSTTSGFDTFHSSSAMIPEPWKERRQ